MYMWQSGYVFGIYYIIVVLTPRFNLPFKFETCLAILHSSLVLG